MQPFGLHLGEVRPYGGDDPPLTRIDTFFACLLSRSYSLMAPNCSMTRAPGPALAVLKSKPSLCSASETSLRLHVVSEKAHRPVAIGEKINRVAHPHWMVIVGIVARHFGARSSPLDPRSRSASSGRRDSASKPACHWPKGVYAMCSPSCEARPPRRSAAATRSESHRPPAPCKPDSRSGGNCSPPRRTRRACHRASSREPSSSAGWNVRRCGTPPVLGTTYTSRLPSYSPVNAMEFPSGEKCGAVFGADS